MRKIITISLVIVLSVFGLQFYDVKAELYEWAQLGGNSMREGRVEVMPDYENLEVIWENNIKWPEDESPMMIKGSPVFDGENVYIPSANVSKNRGLIVKVDRETGKISTFLSSPAPFLSTPVIHNSHLLATSGAYIYDQDLMGKSNRSILLAPDKAGQATESAALYNGTYAYFASKNSDKNLICVEESNGSRIWQAELSAGITADICSTLGFIFAPSDNEKLYAVDEYTGEIKWEKEVYGGFSASPMVLSGELIVPVNGYGIRVFDSESGDVLWQKQMNNVSVIPATDGRLLFLGCEDGSFHALNADMREFEWSIQTSSKITSAPIYGAGVVCFGNEDGEFVFVNSETGETLRSFEFPAIPTAQSLVLNDRIIIPFSNGYITCLGIDEEGIIPDPEPEPEPEPEIYPSTLKIIASETVTLDTEIEIAVDVENADSLYKSEFYFEYDSRKFDYIAAFPGSFLSITNGEPVIDIQPGNGEIKVTVEKQGKLNCPSGMGRLVSFRFVPKEIGTFNFTILDAVHTRCDDVTYEPYIETTSIEVIDPFVPETEFILTPKSIELGEISKPVTEWLKLTQKNGETQTYNVKSSDHRIFEEKEVEGEIAGNDYIEIEVMIDPAKFEPGMRFHPVISVNIAGKTLKCDIFFSTPAKEVVIPEPDPEPNPEPEEPPPCIDVNPANLDFGFVPRGREISIDFELTFETEGEISGVIKTDKNWLRVTPATFKTRSKTVSGIVTISASELPGGSNFVGHLIITSRDNVCQEVTVEAKVETQPSIILEMDIGIPKALIGSLRVNLDQPPIIRNDRTLVPIRFVSESFGSRVQWEASTKKITITRFNDTIVLWVGKKTAIINGSRVTLDVEPSIENGSTIVPIRFISESFGANVEWFHETKHIKITYVPPPGFTP